MSYEPPFLPSTLKEWRKLGDTVRPQFKAKLAERLETSDVPADRLHALWTTDEPVELQVNGSGPFGLNDIDPADDPSR